MKYRVLVSPTAVADADEAHDFLRQRSPAFADKWRDGLGDVMDSLREMPRRFGYAREREPTGLEVRQCLHPPYRVIFVGIGDTVRVAHIRHVRRRTLNRAELDL